MSQVIVVGAGNWGKNLVSNFHALGALAAVAEASPVLRQATAVTYPNVKLYSSFEEALSSSAQAIVIATPAPTHYRFARAALEAGKDVFVEKPMTLKVAEARDLTSLAEQKGQILMVGHLLLYQPAIAWMRDYLASGEAGEVWHIATRRAKLGKVRAEENVWWSFAPHDVSVVLELLGRPQLKGVKALAHPMLQTDIADDVNVLLEFTSGQTAHIHSSWYWPLNERSTTILCEKKMLVYNEVSQTVTVYNKGIKADLSNRDEGSFVAPVTSDEPLKLECQHFLSCIDSREPAHSDGSNGIAVVEILEKAQKAMKEVAYV
ncbi:MAG: Gfo/Idh/MocA family oxidoreductase [Trueperaceae bacterium]|nr:Gfo/Idh/MocA family oxidoreductase [Trueperaceae bacterium]